MADAREELRRYARRVADRWPLEQVFLHRAGDDGEFLVVLVSRSFDGVPWLERIRQAAALWDSAEMGAPAEVHCYTPVELERKAVQSPAVRDAAEHGTKLVPAP